jgi:hypothetical protein
MRKFSALCLVLAICGCQQKQSVSVPTTDQLMADSQLLKAWQGKCDTGEYSQLPAARRTICASRRARRPARSRSRR